MSSNPKKILVIRFSSLGDIVLLTALLEALREVETALVQEQRQAQFLDSLESQLDLARRTYETTRDRYTTGLTEYIRVLESLQSLQALERESVRARRTLTGRRIDLYRAIAGGWELPPPSPVEIEDLNETAADAGRDEQVF